MNMVGIKIPREQCNDVIIWRIHRTRPILSEAPQGRAQPNIVSFWRVLEEIFKMTRMKQNNSDCETAWSDIGH